MPNRIIKESIRTSKSINELSDFEFRFWIYLITYVDDYGRGLADPDILKGYVFPRKKRVTVQNITDALYKMADAGIILLYDVDGESYLCLPNWEKHQRIQTKRSKFPGPEEGSRCSTVNHGEPPLESNPIQSNTIQSESKPNQTKTIQRVKGDGDSANLEKAINTFLQYRKELNKPLTQEGKQLFIQRLCELDPSDTGRIKLINTAIRKGWLDVYPDTKADKAVKKNAFNNFEQRDYDYSELEKKLLKR